MVKKNIHKVLMSKIEKCYKSLYGCSVIIFGAGSYGQWVYGLITQYMSEISLVAFSDNNHAYANNKESTMKLPYVEPQKIKELYPEAVVLICSSWETEISKQLNESGIRYFTHPANMSWIKIQLEKYEQAVTQDNCLYNVWYASDEIMKLEQENKLQDINNKMNAILWDQESKDLYKNWIYF